MRFPNLNEYEFSSPFVNSHLAAASLSITLIGKIERVADIAYRIESGIDGNFQQEIFHLAVNNLSNCIS